MNSNHSVEHALLSDIVSGELEPASKLRMDSLKERYSVGYSPIREALSRLVGDGLVSFEPNKGFSVSPLSLPDLEDIAVARVAVECKALELSIKRGDDRWEANIVAAMYHYKQKAKGIFDGGEGLKEWEKAHDELHKALIGACGSPRLEEMQVKYQMQHLRYRRLTVVPVKPEDAHTEEHEILVDLTLGRKVDEAVGRLEQHMMITVDVLRESGAFDS